ncbi:Glucose--fructose oxidoreductase precursor [Aquisphaera giovannonii]|uniref:Glucose--fructose oxidoreductase n=1 Tax=Aquisphaera giovannonii TaxID=406548 RepID=A0A5B9W2S0_9BACT|nr:Gfo/Idh/MocA family oxidoreductase [Aquisphaera giovannonii]QEH34381.1 Glucose--fructose oxidoreductase precursor [Aquisphaera giovannonii]
MTNLTPEQRILGRENADRALGMTRRDFLSAAGGAAALGGFYFGYKGMGDKPPVKAAIIGTGDEGCQAMIRYHNRDYLNFIGFCDIRPSQQKRAEKEFTDHKQYSPDDVKKLKRYPSKKEMLEDPEVEVVVIALPLWLHAPVAIEAMKAGKHVFTEKLMAHSVAECKEMCRVARETNKLLAVGHQRHYSVLYDNANFLLQNGVLGDVRHIRALWHRNNALPTLAKDKDNNTIYDPKTGLAEFVKDDKGNIVYRDSWKKPIPDDDRNIDYAKFGYKSLEELIRWRLYNRTGAGLMAELGSHQLDACSIFLGKKHPLSVTGFGGTIFYKDGREVDDHVFTVFEFPYGQDDKDRVIVTYSSINTNSFDGYGEMVMGSRGTMIVSQEKEILLYKEAGNAQLSRQTSISVETVGKKPALETSPSLAGPSAASAIGALATADPSRGYREELEHFAYCVRHGNQSNYHDDKEHQPRCRGEVALADAVIALATNIAMRQNRRIEFDPAWFDYKSDKTPEAAPAIAAKTS